MNGSHVNIDHMFDSSDTSIDFSGNVRRILQVILNVEKEVLNEFSGLVDNITFIRVLDVVVKIQQQVGDTRRRVHVTFVREMQDFHMGDHVVFPDGRGVTLCWIMLDLFGHIVHNWSQTIEILVGVECNGLDTRTTGCRDRTVNDRFLKDIHLHVSVMKLHRLRHLLLHWVDLLLGGDRVHDRSSFDVVVFFDGLIFGLWKVHSVCVLRRGLGRRLTSDYTD